MNKMLPLPRSRIKNKNGLEWVGFLAPQGIGNFQLVRCRLFEECVELLRDLFGFDQEFHVLRASRTEPQRFGFVIGCRQFRAQVCDLGGKGCRGGRRE